MYILIINLSSVDGAWGRWKNWSMCSTTCGGGISTRGRDCDSPAPANGGLTCQGEDSQNKSCNLGVCPGNIVNNIPLLALNIC